MTNTPKPGRPIIYSKETIVAEGLKLAREIGYLKVSYESLSNRCKCWPNSIRQQFPTMAKLRRAIMSAAIANEDLKVLAQGLAVKDSKAQNAPDALKRAAVEELL